MTTMADARDRSARPHYGIDAPGVMLGLLAFGMALVLAGAALLAFAPWRVMLIIAGWAVLTVGLIPLGLGCCMLAYAGGGKTRMCERMLDATGWRGDERVLDIGTGAGLLLIGAAKRLRAGHATGIDIWSAKDLSNNTSDVTRRNIRLEGVADRAALVTADARALPMADASFSRVVSLLCLHNIEAEQERIAACQEIARVLQPGGTALIADYVPTTAYAAAFAAAGLRVKTSRPYFLTAYSLMWMVIAEKPHAVEADG